MASSGYFRLIYSMVRAEIAHGTSKAGILEGVSKACKGDDDRWTAQFGENEHEDIPFIILSMSLRAV